MLGGGIRAHSEFTEPPVVADVGTVTAILRGVGRPEGLRDDDLIKKKR
jgi:hypothetical protein